MRDVQALAGIVGLHAALSIVIWLSGSPLGTYGLECTIGTLAHDLTHGLNPAVPWLDYFDTFTGGYLTSAVVSAPFTALPWPTIYATKAGTLLINAGVLVLGWLFLHRNVGRVAAFTGTIALALGPPVLRHHGLIGPTYHFGELLFDLGLAVLWAEIALHGRKGWGWYLGFGLVGGYAITNCFGSGVFVAICGVLLLLIDRRLWTRPAAWMGWVGAAIGLYPLLAKLFWHRGYHIEVRGLRDFGFSHGGGTEAGGVVGKLVGLAFGEFGGALGFGDAFVGGHAFGLLYGAALLLGLGAVIWVARVRLWDAFLGLVPGARFAPSERVARDLAWSLPALFCLGLIVAYATSDLRIHPFDPATSQLREDRFLVPLMAFGALNAGVVAQLLKPRWLLWFGAPLLAGGLLGQLAMVDLAGLSDPGGIPYRGRCYAIQTLFASEVLARQPERAQRFCSGFEDGSDGDCYRGFAWGVGIHRVFAEDAEPLDDPSLPALGGAACDALQPAWQRPCYRQLGWHLHTELMDRGPDVRAWTPTILGWCATMPDAERAGWCVEGLGFTFGDHYAFDPRKLATVFPEDVLDAGQRRSVAAGLGAWFGHAYSGQPTVRRLCKAYAEIGEGLDAACVEGAEATWERIARPMPGGRVEAGVLSPKRAE